MIGAFFDIDGTICRNSLLTEHFKKMIKYELIDSLEYEEKVNRYIYALGRKNWRL